MRPDDIRDLLRQAPFLPLRLFLTDGTVHDIRHPESAILMRTTVSLVSPGSDVPLPSSDRRVIIALLHITRIEQEATTVLPTAN
jgi:hypothetical protein